MRRIAVITGVVALVLTAGVTGALLSRIYWQNHLSTAAKARSSSTNPVSLIACATSNLTGSVTPDDSNTTDSTYMSLVLQNSGSTSCTVQGFPKAQLLDASGNDIGKAAQHDGANGPGDLMTLAPTGTAKAILHFTTGNSSPNSCKQGAAALRITPPNDTQSLAIPITTANWCPGFSITALTQNG